MIYELKNILQQVGLFGINDAINLKYIRFNGF